MFQNSTFSLQGTEPPEPTHKKPDKGAATDNTAGVETGQHEEGEVEVKPNVWEFPVAQTKKGLLWGTIEESRSSKRILAFRGIQHIKAPVGPLRWKPPVPSPAWEGIREAKLDGHRCPQHMYYKPDIWVGQEDCLWLNVFTRGNIFVYYTYPMHSSYRFVMIQKIINHFSFPNSIFIARNLINHVIRQNF